VSAVREEVVRLVTWEERHRRLLARLTLLVAATLVVDAVGTVAVYFVERHAKQTDVKTLFDAFFFTTVQLLTISSSLTNPVTTGGKVVDIFLELWGVLAIAGSAGALASFFQSGDA
jgi:Ion channel